MNQILSLLGEPAQGGVGCRIGGILWVPYIMPMIYGMMYGRIQGIYNNEKNMIEGTGIAVYKT